MTERHAFIAFIAFIVGIMAYNALFNKPAWRYSDVIATYPDTDNITALDNDCADRLGGRRGVVVVDLAEGGTVTWGCLKR